MLKRCLSCHRELPGNEEIESFPVARRVAFDPRRGRLWAICTWCGHCSLAPFDRRWEALEELERQSRDRARLLMKTDHIGLLQLGSIQLIRVGECELREEAWWRYGKTLRGRRLRYGIVTAVGGSAAIATVVGLVAGIATISFSGDLFIGTSWKDIKELPRATVRTGAQVALNLDRRMRYGAIAWRGRASCRRCGGSITQLAFKDRGRLIVDSERSLRRICYRCGARAEDAGYRIQGLEAEHLLRRILAFENHAGATESDLENAVALIQRMNTPAEARADGLWTGRFPFGDYSRERKLALEMVVNEEVERELLALEVAELAARWQEEEELAQIIDGELTPWPTRPGSAASAGSGHDMTTSPIASVSKK